MRIAIVNDVPLAVEALRRVVSTVSDYAIAWIAEDGEAAVRQCAGDVPDLILMDLLMPRMDGVQATRRIMKESPCAILVVTATVEGQTGRVFEAMGCGALDAVDTPVLGLSGDAAGAGPLLAKIAMLRQLTGKSRSKVRPVPTPTPRQSGTNKLPLVAIGASTGGPAALSCVLRAIPRDIFAAIALVQHVDEQFAPGLASWLAGQTGHKVTAIRPLDRPAQGHVLLASTNDHLVLTMDVAYAYTPEPADYPFRPSVDVFFQSVATFWPGPIVGVLLTGMGSDGAQGLLGLRRAGWHTIAQDESTSVVYGMPKAARKIGAVVEMLPIDRIAPAIVRAVQGEQPKSSSERSSQ